MLVIPPLEYSEVNYFFKKKINFKKIKSAILALLTGTHLTLEFPPDENACLTFIFKLCTDGRVPDESTLFNIIFYQHVSIVFPPKVTECLQNLILWPLLEKGEAY